MNIRSALSIGLLAASFLGATQVQAADNSSSCQGGKSADAVSRLAQSEDCLNSHLRRYQDQMDQSRQRQEQRLKALQDKYTNAPEKERARLERQIKSEQQRFETQRQKQMQKFNELKDKYTNAPQQMRQQMTKKLDQKMDALKADRDQRMKRLQDLRDSQKQDADRLKALGQKTRSDLGNFFNNGH